MKYIRIIVSMIMLTSLTFSVNSFASIPYQDIVSIPDTDNLILSPNGELIAYKLAIQSEQRSGVLVVLYNIKTKASSKLLYSENSKYLVNDISWGSDEILLIKASFPSNRQGTELKEYRLLKYDIKSKKLTGVLSRSFLNRLQYMPNVLTRVVDTLPKDPDHILMQIGGLGQFSGDGLVRVPITKKGKTKVIQNAKEFATRWILDSKGKPRIALFHEEGQFTVKEVLPNKKMKALWTFESFSEKQVWPRGFGADNDILYVEALHNGKDAIFKVDLTDPNLTKQLVFNHKNRDVSGRLRRDKQTNEYVGIGYHYWDEGYKSFVKAIDKALPNRGNLLLDKSADGNQYILLSNTDNEPGVYYIGDRKNNTLDYVASRYSKLNPDVLAKKESIRYEARDGLKIHGYLTYPKGKEKKNLPTIIFPHGGPISRTSKKFDYWTQFFANKGYAVLQMNFRGSSGYGFDFMQMGLASWGQAMQDDVEDGARWLIEQGITDKDKMCIVGGSYGGYAALMGGIKTPDLYQCIISFAGVTDLPAILQDSKKYTNYEVVKKQIGDDYSKLSDVSPVNFADKIKAPVLLIHGTKDLVVKVNHSEDMFDELEDEDKVVEYIELEGANHYLSNNKHRLQAFSAMDKFLDKHLPLTQ